MSQLISSPPQQAIFDAGVVLSDRPGDGVGIEYGDTFRLHSNPGSGLKIYLDFDAHVTTGSSWNTYWNTASIHSPAFSFDGSEAFNAAELTAIQQIWQCVAEIYAPFNLDVTTEDPGLEALRYGGADDTAYGIRVVITDEEGKDHGGMAYPGSFLWSGSEAPAFVYANRLADNAAYIAAAAAHETGHTLGLSHDGVPGSEYYYGHGAGATDWAPVMGAGYYSSVLQFSKGEYAGATQLQDDLAIIVSQNAAVAFRGDDYGNSFEAAAPLAGVSHGSATLFGYYGLIAGSGPANDVDMFSVKVAAGGSLTVNVSTWSQVWVSGRGGPVYDQSPVTSLDIKVTIYDASRHVILIADDPDRTDATVNLSGLAGGTYYVAIDGAGSGNPMAAAPTGYTEYGSLGPYLITGNYTTAPSFAAADFDRRAWYLHANPDVAAAGVDPILHYEMYGWREGRNPEVLFDTRYYLQRNPDVAAAGVNPYHHYSAYGWAEGRNPSPQFDANHYLAANPDVAAAHINPLLHYEMYGFHEGRAIWAV